MDKRQLQTVKMRREKHEKDYFFCAGVDPDDMDGIYQNFFSEFHRSGAERSKKKEEQHEEATTFSGGFPAGAEPKSGGLRRHRYHS